MMLKPNCPSQGGQFFAGLAAPQVAPWS